MNTPIRFGEFSVHKENKRTNKYGRSVCNVNIDCPGIGRRHRNDFEFRSLRPEAGPDKLPSPRVTTRTGKGASHAKQNPCIAWPPLSRSSVSYVYTSLDFPPTPALPIIRPQTSVRSAVIIHWNRKTDKSLYAGPSLNSAGVT